MLRKRSYEEERDSETYRGLRRGRRAQEVRRIALAGVWSRGLCVDKVEDRSEKRRGRTVNERWRSIEECTILTADERRGEEC